MDKKTSSIGRRTCQLRKAKGLTQAALARLCGVDSVTVSRWERNAGSPGFEHLSRLAETLGTSPAWLACGDEQAALPVSVVEGLHSKLEEYNANLRELIRREGENRKQLEAEVSAFMAKRASTQAEIVAELVEKDVAQVRTWPAPLLALQTLVAKCRRLNAAGAAQAGALAAVLTASADFERVSREIDALLRKEEYLKK